MSTAVQVLPPEEKSEEKQERPVFQELYELSEKEREEEFGIAISRFNSSEEFMATMYPKMLKYYKRYRSIADPIKDELGREVKGRSNLYIPYPWAIVESELPRLAGRIPRVRAFPRKREERIKVESIEDLIYYSLDRTEMDRDWETDSTIAHGYGI